MLQKMQCYLLISLMDFIFYIPLPQQKHTLPQRFGDENDLCIAGVRNDIRLLGAAQILRCFRHGPQCLREKDILRTQACFPRPIKCLGDGISLTASAYRSI